MKKAFLFLGLIETISALVLFLRPDLLFIEDTPSIIAAIKLFAIGQFSLGILAFQIFKFFDLGPLVKMIIFIFILFHSLLAFHLYSLYSADLINNIYWVIFHFILSLTFVLIYYINLNRFIK